MFGMGTGFSPKDTVGAFIFRWIRKALSGFENSRSPSLAVESSERDTSSRIQQIGERVARRGRLLGHAARIWFPRTSTTSDRRNDSTRGGIGEPPKSPGGAPPHPRAFLGRSGILY